MRIDIRLLLSYPAGFKLFKFFVIGKYYRTFVNEYVRCKKGDRVLDIGCGYGDVLEYLSDVEYTGFDMNRRYIEAALKKYGNKGKFSCDKLSCELTKENGHFDKAIAIGVLHHLCDEEVITLLHFTKKVLKRGAKFISVDPCFIEKQSAFARYLFTKDRGKFIRTADAYKALISEVYESAQVSIRQDLLHVPYTNIIIECQNSND
jgi:cyclopropane fatty-acyl-phospholipid synthase-like methyltransferase